MAFGIGGVYLLAVNLNVKIGDYELGANRIRSYPNVLVYRLWLSNYNQLVYHKSGVPLISFNEDKS